MLAFTNRLTTLLTHPPVRSLLIVARDHGDLYETLRTEYGDSETLTVLLDRRQGERRRRAERVLADRRRADRRIALSIAEDLRLQPYVLVRPHYRRARD